MKRVQMLLLLLFYSTARTNAETKGNQQRIVVEPEDTEVMLGENVTLKCKVEHQVGAVMWTRGGVGLGDQRSLPHFERYTMGGSAAEDEWNLEISAATMEDDSTYECQMLPKDVGHKLQKSRAARLTVLVAPKAPKLVNFGSLIPGIEGQEMNVTCVSEDGNPAAELFWVIADDPQGIDISTRLGGHNVKVNDKKDSDKHRLRKNNKNKSDKHSKSSGKALRNERVGRSVHASGRLWTTHSVLSFTPKAEDDDKYLVCIAKHQSKEHECETKQKCETPTASSKLSLEYIPVVEVWRKDESEPLREGTTLMLHCKVDAKPPMRQVQWLRDGVRIQDATYDKYEITRLTSKHDKSVFSCEATNARGTRGKDYPLKVQYAPKLLSNRLTQTVNVNDDVTMSCVVNSNPAADIVWTREFTDFPELHRGQNYTIRSVRLTQQGGYRCTATAPGFPSASWVYYLRINGKPLVSLQPRYEAEVGSFLELVCNISGFPTADDNRWYKDGVLVAESRTRQMPQQDGVVKILTISKLQQSDFGVYNCSARNTEGSHSAVTRLTAIDPLPLYFLIPGVIVAIVLVLLLTLALVLMNRRACCGGKSSHNGDSQSEVHVKVESMDGHYIPDMYSPAPVVENGDPYGSAKDYIPVPQDNPDLDLLPPPYGGQQQFIYQPNGSVVAVGNVGNGSSSQHQLLPYDPYMDGGYHHTPLYGQSPPGGMLEYNVPSPSLPNGGHLFHPPLPQSGYEYGSALERVPELPTPTDVPVTTPLLPSYRHPTTAGSNTSTFKPASNSGSGNGEDNRPSSRGSTHV